MKRALLAALAALVGLGAVVCVRALRLESRQVAVGPTDLVPVDSAAIADRLGRAIRIPTVSYLEAERVDPAAFAAFHAFLAEAFPAAHALLSRETVGTWSLAYTWPGSDPALPPLLLTAHFDVVPVDPGSEGRWTHPPFSGEIADGQVWGRGAIDDKAGVVSLLAAVEALAARGFAPRRTVLLFFGHDEERSGEEGAARFAAMLTRQGVEPFLLLDEWMPIAKGLLDLERPVALVRIAEKAYLTVELAVEGEGGHSSVPPRETAVGILARAVSRLEAAPMPARLAGPARQMLDHLAPELPFGRRLVLGNLWLLRPLVLRQLAASPGTDAMVRTTTAPTMLRGSVKDNVLATRATAAVNFRILPGDTVEGVLEHARRVIDDPRVAIEPQGRPADPHPPSETGGEPFALVARSIRETLPEALVAPALLVGTSDARYYEGLSRAVYGFRPVRLGPEDLARFHGTNERIAVDDLVLGVRFFARLIENAAGP